MLPHDYVVTSAVTSATNDSAEVEFRLDPDWLYFKGHFLASPLLPGVTQLDFACNFFRLLFKTEPEVASIPCMKFLRPQLPGDTVRLSLKFERKSGRLDFVYYLLSPEGPDTEALYADVSVVTASKGCLKLH